MQLRPPLFVILAFVLGLASCAAPIPATPTPAPLPTTPPTLAPTATSVPPTATVVPPTPTPTAAPTTTPTVTAKATSAASCPRAGDAQVLQNDAHGYCLLYPAGYSSEQPNPDETILYVGSVLDVEHPHLSIEVTGGNEGGAGQSAAEAANMVINQVKRAMPDFKIEQSQTTLGGEPAIVLDKLPGQDLNRQVLVVRDDRLYRLVFSPADPGQGDAYTEMEALYRMVRESFRFLTEGALSQ